MIRTELGNGYAKVIQRSEQKCYYVLPEQTIRTNYVKHHIDKTSENPLCRLCGKNGESVQNFVSGCEKFAQREYKRRHNNVANKVHWDLCKKYGLENTENGVNTSQKKQ